MYEHALSLLGEHHIDLAHASIDKARLATRYGGAADENAYRLALQFLIDKVVVSHREGNVLVADEARE